MRGESHGGNGSASHNGADGVNGSRESGRTDCSRTGRENGRTDCGRAGRESRRVDCGRAGRESSECYARRRRAMLRQRRLRRRRRITVCLWTVCLILAGVFFFAKRGGRAGFRAKRSDQRVVIKEGADALKPPGGKEN